MNSSLEAYLIDYLRYRLSINAGYISSHEFESARDWILQNKDKRYNVDTVTRTWRKLRESGKVEAVEQKLPGSKQMTWKIVYIKHNTPHRLRLR